MRMERRVKLTIAYVIEIEDLEELEKLLTEKDEQSLCEIFGVGWEDASEIKLEEVG